MTRDSLHSILVSLWVRSIQKRVGDSETLLSLGTISAFSMYALYVDGSSLEYCHRVSKVESFV